MTLPRWGKEEDGSAHPLLIAPGQIIDTIVDRLDLFGQPAEGAAPPSKEPPHHLPMQNWLKIVSSKSSVVVLPTISPTALVAMRRSSAASSRPSSSRKAPVARSMAPRARCKAS